MVGDKPLRPLDVISCELIEPAPLHYQAENWLIDPASIEYIRTADPSEYAGLLDQKARETPDMFDSNADEVFESEYSSVIADGLSLGLISVDETILVRTDRWRVLATRGEQNWSLKISDEYLIAALDAEAARAKSNRLSYGPSSICVSLIDPFMPYNNASRHYKLAAGIAFTG